MFELNKNKIKYSNLNYLNEIKSSILDPMGRDISNDIRWISLESKWSNENFPVVMSGQGDPIILLHGFDSSFLEFRRIYPLLKNNFKLIIPDLFGFGFSPRISGIKYCPNNIVDNICNLLSELNLNQKIKIIGASMGGSVALSLLKIIPNDIDKIILLSPAGLFGEPKSIPIPLNQIGAAFLGLPIVRKNLCRQAFAYPEKSVGAEEEQIASIHLGCKGWRNSLASFARSGGFAGTYEKEQNVPTKTICGENDRILGNKELNKLKTEKNLNFIKLKNCGHLPHLDLPHLTGKIIIDFFQ